VSIDPQPTKSHANGVRRSAMTDLWFESRGSGGTAAVSVDFEVLLEDD
jgi:hypothetical protein